MKVGDKIAVIPSHMNSNAVFWVHRDQHRKSAVGTVVYTNVPHRYCVLEYASGIRDGFKIWSEPLKAAPPDIHTNGFHWRKGWDLKCSTP